MYNECTNYVQRGEVMMDSAEKDFFRKIKEATFANPFGPERESVDLQISGMAMTSSNEAILTNLIEKVEKRIKKYEGKATDLPAEERHLLRYGVLFYLFHLYCDAYDALIDSQIEAKEQPCKVDFAREVLQLLCAYGFSREEALQYFAFFFQLRRGFYFISNIKGKSRSVRLLRQSLWNNIFTYDATLYEEHLWNRMEDFSTIILGETGTGKGMAAAAIGRSGYIPFMEKKGSFSESFARTFISINLSQYSRHLIESELFGHKKGAFTGAVENHRGIFSRCSPHGAIFLDEIGEVSTPLQIKLLQVLQEREFSPVGSHDVEKFSGRVIAATNQPLKDLRQKGSFRDDFYYRLSSDIIKVPSLKKRIDEFPGEMQELLAGTLQRILGYSSRSLELEIGERIEESIPRNYPWPGNIRELEQCVRQMLLNRSYAWDQNPVTTDPEDTFTQRFREGDFTASELLSIYCSHLYHKYKTLEKVAKKVQLDRRTVKKYLSRDD